MNHLTEEQLGAFADGMLEGAPRDAAERHLASCAACRDALAAQLALDRDLRVALEHDPGEDYFETFAARVGGRIRPAGPGGARARAPEARGLADWFRSPRKLAALGAVATVVVVAGVVMLSTREVTMPVLRHGGARRAAEPVAPPAEAPARTGVVTEESRAADAVTASPPVAEREVPPAPPEGEAKSFARAPDRELARSKKGGPPAAGAPPTQAETSEGMRYRPEAGGGEDRLAAPAPAVPVVADDGTTATRSEEGPAEGSAATANEERRAKGPGAGLLQPTRQTLAATKSDAAAEDAFAGQPTFTTVHGRNALRLTRLAETMRVAPAWDSAAEEWAMVLLGTQGTPLEGETRWQLARARWRAWRAGASERRAATAGEAFAGFLGMAPEGARRDSVMAWRTAVGK